MARAPIGRRRLTLTVVPLFLAAAVSACAANASPNEVRRLIIVPDRTASTQDASWPPEVATQTKAALDRAFAQGVTHVDLLSIGANTDQTATTASADLTSIDGNTEAKRQAARDDLARSVSSLAGQLAAEPVEGSTTDVFAALQQAASLCHAPDVSACSVLLLSDLEDQRVLAQSSPQEAVDALAKLLPDLSGVTVQVSGLGASGSDAETVELVRVSWTLLLERAGAVNVRIARSL